MSLAGDVMAMPRRATTLRFGAPAWVLIALAAAALGIVFFSGIQLMITWWQSREEYSHGWLIPVVAAFLVWQRSDVLRHERFAGSWWGVALVVLGLLLWLAGELSALYTVIQYSFLLTLTGAALALLGARAFGRIWTAFFILLFMVPLPNFIYFNLSQKLQLLSSEIGVGVIRLFGISVYLEGNVIDLGTYRLQVAEACSGLRYLFPLMTLSFIVALFFRAPFWQRATLFLSAAPITVLMNSVRIGIIGILVDRFGTAQAEGFLHQFEGWVIFMACFALLLVEMWALRRLTGDRRAFREVFALELPARAPVHAAPERRELPASAIAATALLIAATVPALLVPDRIDVVPPRSQFSEFPMQLNGWSGRRGQLDAVYVDELKLSDYMVADFTQGAGSPVNLYIAFYDSQRKGESAHSPKGCLPGGGWVIRSFGQRSLPAVSREGHALAVNRAVIAQGSSQLLVYYWFQQRGRNLTNEYLVKWFLFWDSLTRNRSDGSMVRLIVPITASDGESQADATLQRFAHTLAPVLSTYVPD